MTSRQVSRAAAQLDEVLEAWRILHDTFTSTPPTLPCPYQEPPPLKTAIGPAPQQPDTSISPDDIAKGLGVLNSSLDLVEMLPYIHMPGPVGMVLDAGSQWASDAGLNLSPGQRVARVSIAVLEGQGIAYVTGGMASAAGSVYIESGPGAFVAFAGVYIVDSTAKRVRSV